MSTLYRLPAARRRMSDRILSDLLEREYFALAVRVRAEKTRQQYRFALHDLAEFLGRAPTTRDLCDDTMTRFVLWLRDVRTLHPRTCNDRRGRLNALWRWSADRGLLATRPTNAGLTEPERTPDAWSRDELRRLIAACAASPGTMGQLPASTFWLAFHALAWDTGARTSEITALQWEWLDRASGWLRVPADVRKGRRKPAVYRLQPDTLALLDQIRKPSGPILAWDMNQTLIWIRYKELLKRAGLSATRYDGPQKLRRSHASWLASNDGDATLSLGHSSAATTRRFYLDPTIAGGPPASEQLPFRLLSLGDSQS